MSIKDVLKINGRLVPRNKIVPNKCNLCLNAKVFCKCDDSQEEQATIVAPVMNNNDELIECTLCKSMCTDDELTGINEENGDLICDACGQPD